MKDMPARFAGRAIGSDTELMHRVFDVWSITDAVLRTVFQLIRSGQFKNKSGKASRGIVKLRAAGFQRLAQYRSVGKLLKCFDR